MWCTGPDEHLMSDLERIKISLHLTDVVVLRHEVDTVNFSGLEITKTSRDFEVRNSTDLVESLLNLYGLENSKPTANPGRRSTVMELPSATPVDGHDYSNFRGSDHSQFMRSGLLRSQCLRRRTSGTCRTLQETALICSQFVS